MVGGFSREKTTTRRRAIRPPFVAQNRSIAGYYADAYFVRRPFESNGYRSLLLHPFSHILIIMAPCMAIGVRKYRKKERKMQKKKFVTFEVTNTHTHGKKERKKGECRRRRRRRR